jgi:hypothetical protein
MESKAKTLSYSSPREILGNLHAAVNGRDSGYARLQSHKQGSPRNVKLIEVKLKLA